MIIEKVLNNNVIVSIDPSSKKEVILMGCGIAFKKKIGQVSETAVPCDENTKTACSSTHVFTHRCSFCPLPLSGVTKPVRARHVRLVIEENGTQWGASLWRFEVRGFKQFMA